MRCTRCTTQNTPHWGKRPGVLLEPWAAERSDRTVRRSSGVAPLLEVALLADSAADGVDAATLSSRWWPRGRKREEEEEEEEDVPDSAEWAELFDHVKGKTYFWKQTHWPVRLDPLLTASRSSGSARGTLRARSMWQRIHVHVPGTWRLRNDLACFLREGGLWIRPRGSCPQGQGPVVSRMCATIWKNTSLVKSRPHHDHHNHNIQHTHNNTTTTIVTSTTLTTTTATAATVATAATNTTTTSHVAPQ